MITKVQLYAFDIAALDSDNLRRLPLSMRKTNLARLLARLTRTASSLRHSNKARSAPELFRAACRTSVADLNPETAVSLELWFRPLRARNLAPARTLSPKGASPSCEDEPCRTGNS